MNDRHTLAATRQTADEYLAAMVLKRNKLFQEATGVTSDDLLVIQSSN